MSNNEGHDQICTNFFSNPDECRAFGLEVEDQLFWIPKDGLCAYSPVFKNMLYGEFAESKRNTVKLPNKKIGDVLELLLCLFPTPVVKKIDEVNVDLLLELADEYQIADLTSRCCDFLQQKLDQLRNGDEKLIDILVLASKHRLRPILFLIVERCADCFELEKFEPIFDQLSSEVLGAIAWHKCKRATLNPRTNQSPQWQAESQTQQFPSPCNNCRNGHTQNRCTLCGGAQRCPLCNSLPRRSRPCACSNALATLARGASVTFMADLIDSDKNDISDKSNAFDGATMLLKRL